MNVKERILRFISEQGLRKSEFERRSGLSNGYLNNFKGRLGDDKLNGILSAFPELNKVWLLTGEGLMLNLTGGVHQPGDFNNAIGRVRVSGEHNSNIGNIRNERSYGVSERKASPEGIGVPYYDVDFIGGFDVVMNDQTATPAHYIQFPQYAKADSWVNATGHSMEPLINHGDMIALKRIEDWDTYLLYGEIYAIVTDEYRTIKYVRRSSKGDDFLRLVPENPDHDEQDIPKSIVTGVFQVLGCAKKLF